MTLRVLSRPEPLSADDLAAYAHLDVGVVSLPAPVRWVELTGEKAVDALNGLITNDVSTLAEGASMRAVALTPKGKVLADLRVLRQGATQLALIMDDESAEAFVAMARKYVNPRLAVVRDVTAEGRCWWLVGAGLSSLGALPTGVTGVARDDFGDRPSMLLRAVHADVAAVEAWLAQHTSVAGSTALGEVLRVEAGQPAFGLDMDDATIPQEANLDTLGAISFSKGCYTGQETVARVHFRGHVNRHLRGLRALTAIPGGASLVDQDGKAVGDVRSTVLSPTFGAIALGMIRREIAEGATVMIQPPEGSAFEATVTVLPFSG